MFITPVPEDAATGDVATMYAADREHWGFLPNFTRAFSHHPEAYAAWVRLITSIRGNMDRRRCELATLAAARTIGTTYCSVAHANMLRQWFDEPTLAALARDHHDVGLDDVDALRAHGLGDRDVLDIVLAVAARSFFATVIEALDARADAPLASMLDDELVELLTVGRPVATAGPAEGRA